MIIWFPSILNFGSKIFYLFVFFIFHLTKVQITSIIFPLISFKFELLLTINFQIITWKPETIVKNYQDCNNHYGPHVTDSVTQKSPL